MAGRDNLPITSFLNRISQHFPMKTEVFVAIPGPFGTAKVRSGDAEVEKPSCEDPSLVTFLESADLGKDSFFWMLAGSWLLLEIMFFFVHFELKR